jgi:hypothetical protein
MSTTAPRTVSDKQKEILRGETMAGKHVIERNLKKPQDQFLEKQMNFRRISALAKHSSLEHGFEHELIQNC